MFVRIVTFLPPVIRFLSDLCKLVKPVLAHQLKPCTGHCALCTVAFHKRTKGGRWNYRKKKSEEKTATNKLWSQQNHSSIHSLELCLIIFSNASGTIIKVFQSILKSFCTIYAIQMEHLMRPEDYLLLLCSVHAPNSQHLNFKTISIWLNRICTDSFLNDTILCVKCVAIGCVSVFPYHFPVAKRTKSGKVENTQNQCRFNCV